ncbi:unnamed protein product [Discula destructiva]
MYGAQTSPSHQIGLLDGAQDAAGSTWSQLRRSLSTARPGKMLNPPTLLRGLKGFLSPRYSRVDDKDTRPLRPTAYLDGLRGFAAFLVYWHHHVLWSHSYVVGKSGDILENAWGYNGHYHLATFYGTRLFFTGGHLAVAIFYVISGYVLTQKALTLIQAGQHVRVGEVVASALFRRWFRLYIPLIVTTFVYVTSWHVFGIWTPQTEPKATYGEEVWNWYVEFKNFSFVFKEGSLWPSYNGHLWSIPLEMRGSVVTYVAALTLARATTKARLLCEVGLVIYFLYICDAWYAAVFMAGMLQADLDLLARRPEPNSGFPRFLRDLERYKTYIVWGCLLLALFFSGVPCHTNKMDELRANPGWYWLSYLKPQAVFDPKWFFLAIAANLVVFAVPRVPAIKAFFEGPFCQYLGYISFSLYLVHGPLLAVVGDRVYTAVGWASPVTKSREMLAWWIDRLPLPTSGPLGLEPAFLLPHIILLPLTLSVAGFVTRTVDEPSVKLAQWFWNLVNNNEPQTPHQNGRAITSERAE